MAFISVVSSSHDSGCSSGQMRTEQRLEPAGRPARVPAVVVLLAPLVRRAELHGRLDHRDRRRIGRALDAADLAEDGLHLGEAAQDAVLVLQLALRLLDRDVRERDRHVEQIALVERRHELVAQVHRDRDRRGEREQPDRDRRLRPPERDVHERLVEADEEARDRVLLLGRDLAADEDVLQRRRERDRQQRRDQHDERLRVGERLEEAPGLAGQREDRQERDRDDEQREEDRRRHLLRRLDQQAVPVGAGAGVLELLVAGLDHHDLRVDRRADGDGDAAQAHDRRRDVEQHHRDERRARR